MSGRARHAQGVERIEDFDGFSGLLDRVGSVSTARELLGFELKVEGSIERAALRDAGGDVLDALLGACRAEWAHARHGVIAGAIWLLLAECGAWAGEGLHFGFEPAARFGVDARTIVMTLRGEVAVGDAARFAQFVVAHRERFVEHGGRVVFAIDGGDVLEALRIGELLREALVEAWLPDAASSRCVSACFFMFAHSASRSAVADAVGLHRPYFDPEALTKASPAAVRRRYEELAAQVRARMEQLSVPVALVERMFSLPGGQVYWLSQQDLASLGGRQAWFEDFLAARCGRLEEVEAASPSPSASSCIERLLRSHRKEFVDRLSRDGG